jgi:hypothetical protein
MHPKKAKWSNSIYVYALCIMHSKKLASELCTILMLNNENACNTDAELTQCIIIMSGFLARKSAKL